MKETDGIYLFIFFLFYFFFGKAKSLIDIIFV